MLLYTSVKIIIHSRILFHESDTISLIILLKDELNRGILILKSLSNRRFELGSSKPEAARVPTRSWGPGFYGEALEAQRGSDLTGRSFSACFIWITWLAVCGWSWVVVLSLEASPVIRCGVGFSWAASVSQPPRVIDLTIPILQHVGVFQFLTLPVTDNPVVLQACSVF